uniref:Uncharacterized protein n=1 Tax=Candidatus Methanogaster sp. ANME-2c ERB4 TaxID=2759911 RepID=A0A7G9Y4G4_9EURY|nr:hypothetical protein NICIAEDM_00005 [Methanosarcinales archaeon ANME-2c ERB4]
MKRTSCMAEGITDHIWAWKELLMFKRHVAKQPPTQESCTPPSRKAPSIQQNFR